MRMMKASEFESRHPDLLRLLIFGTAVLAYGVDRDDIVWAMLHWHTAKQIAWARVIFGLAAILVAASASLRTWARAYSHPAYGVLPNTGDIVAGGPFRFMRYPWILGDVCFVIGIGALLNRTGLLIAVGGLAVLDLRLLNREETDLEKRLGRRNFHQLCESVPLVWPFLSSHLAHATYKPVWRGAIRAEFSHWGYFIMLGAFAFTLRDGVAWSLAALSLLIGVSLNLGKLHRTAVRNVFTLFGFVLAGSTFLHAQSGSPVQDHPGSPPAVGSEIFKVQCLKCHSTDSQSKPGPSLEGAVREGKLSDDQARTIIKNGVNTMPPFGRKLSDRDIDAVIRYLKTL